MCLPGQPPGPPGTPASAADAAAMAQAALGWLAEADVASLTTAEQADCLRSLERARSMHTAAQARILAAFHAQDGSADDGHGSTRTWLKWQTQISGGAAGEAMGWMRRLSAHPAVAGALASAGVSESWARHICEWTGRLPAEHRGDADQILLAAAAGGAGLRDLEGLAEEIRKQTARPDTGDDDGFDDRGVRLARTFRGAGKLGGDLTAPCAAALAAVLEALGRRTGPEDRRTKDQRAHDALEEACRRLVASGCLPDRAGQPTHIQLLMTLDQLRGLPGGGGAEAAWAAAAGYDCDATIVPVVTGHVDTAVLDQLTTALLDRLSPGGWHARPGQPSQADRGREAGQARRELAARALRQILTARAADLLSGPAGLAACLRTGLLDGPAASVSLPLDAGAATETIPAHLRRLVTARDRHCRFPGCAQPPAACQPHHIIPRSQGGKTSLTNLLLLCRLCRRRHKVHYADLRVMPIWMVGAVLCWVMC
jgi:Domain of unknown function (DUF222)/HNH endonuclease